MFLNREKIIKEAKSILRNKFAKSVAIITGGTTIVYILSILSSPIITRIYSPEEFGTITVFTSVLSILSVISSLQYEWVIPIVKTDKKAVNIIALCLVTLFLYVFIITGILFFFGDSFLGIFNAGELLEYRVFIPVGLFLLGLYQILMQWAFRKKKFKIITGSKITQSLGQNISKIGLGYLKWGPLGLLTGWIIGEMMAVLVLFVNFIKTAKQYIKEISYKEMIYSVKRYVDFPLYSAPGQFLNTLGVELPSLIMTTIYGPDIVGFFALANSVTNLPMSLIGTAIGDVFYSEAASLGKQNPERLLDLTQKLQKRLILIVVPPLLLLFLFGPFLFSFVFGSEWKEAGNYASLMTILVFSRFVFTPISRVFNILEKQRKALFINIFRIVLTILSFGSAVLFNLEPPFAIFLYSVLTSIVYFVTFMMAQDIIKKEIRREKML